jgi:glutathione synthase/RimK-type ligase-like ATP-grasp enzyme
MIIIPTSKRDGHVGAVTKHLDAVGIPWCRINTEDFTTNVEVDVDPVSGAGRLHLRDSDRIVNLSEVSAVWYRKPDPVDVTHFEMDPGALEYVEAEFNEILMGLYALLHDVFWFNNPFRARIAHRKLRQLRVAASVGFSVPESLLTNDPKRAVEFANSIRRDIAIKSLGAISVMQEDGGQTMQYGIFTRRLRIDELQRHQEKISFMPTLFQEFIEKESELRVTCVGNDVFACEITSRSNDETADDYRFDTGSLPHKAVERPDLIDRMQAYMKAFGLNFGCFDFIVPKAGGDPVFLEMNPNGQWLWVQERTGQNIASAVAEQLIQHSILDNPVPNAGDV